MKIDRRMAGRLDDRQLADLWAETSRNEYAAALVLRYLPMLYGVALKFTGSEEGACAEVREFVGEYVAAHDRDRRMYDLIRGERPEAQVLAGTQEGFVRRLAEGDDAAMAVFEDGKSALTKPQRVCIEMLLRDGATLETIAAGTGYLTDGIRHYVETGVAALVPDDGAPGEAYDVSEAVSGHFLNYIKGVRTGAEANRIEVASMLDPFVSDALEGVFTVQGDHVRNIAELDREIEADCFTRRGRRVWIWIVAAVCLIAAGAYVYVSHVDGGRGAAAPVAKQPEGVPSGVSALAETPDGTAAAAKPPSAAPEQLPVADTLPEPEKPAVDEPGATHVSLASISTDAESGRPVSMPRIGRRRYDDYLAESAVPLTDGARGDVTLTFGVNNYGRPSRIRVVGFLSPEAHREAIRLLENGPEWSQSDTEVVIEMRFE